MVVQGELPEKRNRRGGPGWWMDLDGVWRAPEEWPEDYPPLDGWVRDTRGRWSAPDEEDHEPIEAAVLTIPEPEAVDPAPTESRQARADRRAMYTVAGVVGGAMMLLVGALIVITQAGASDGGDSADDVPEVIYAAETDADRARRQREAADAAPEQARLDLAALDRRTSIDGDDDQSFDADSWVVAEDGCLDVSERVLVDRSEVPIQWADNLECVPDTGRWTDRGLGEVLERTLDAEVVPLVPASVAFASGGATWSAATRQAFLTDTAHRATLQIVASDSGFNPRSADPSAWRPASKDVWCAYAVDWVAVKTRWELDVHAAEAAALTEMLDTCALETSLGADPATVAVQAIPAPQIEHTSDDA